MPTRQTGTWSPPDEFVRSLGECGVTALADLRPAAGRLAPGVLDGVALAREMVEAGQLTAYQAAAVLERRFADLTVGNYEILDRIGAGGMGTVYKARHRRMKRVVALKVLGTDAARDPSFAQRFQREVETIARLAHPNVVMAFDADEADRGPFLVMEFVDGRDLASEVAKAGPLAVADAVGCLLQAARGLEYAHAQGIVHRDIKPGNILRDAGGVIKVADLGLARLNGPAAEGAGGNTSLTQAGGIVGTLDFMPPEQALDSTAIDRRADVYSLGCTLYYLLTGKPPYQAGSLMALLLKHREAEIPSLREARPDAPAELDAVFRRMMAKDPADRFPSMTEVIAALEELRRTVRLGDARPGTFEVNGSGVDNSGATMALDTDAASAARDTSRVILGTGTKWEDPPAAPAAGPLAGRVVVLAEPSRAQAGIIRRYLQQLGAAAVHPAASGKEAHELARRERADAVVCAMHLGDMTGLQLAHAVLADPACPRTGVVLATSETEADDGATLPDSPRAVLMPKPFDQARLAVAVVAVAPPAGR